MVCHEPYNKEFDKDLAQDHLCFVVRLYFPDACPMPWHVYGTLVS